MEALAELQRRFYKHYPESELDRKYKFACSSSMKPTRWEVPPGTINIIPGECSISGDIRLSPFYSCVDVQKKVGGSLAWPLKLELAGMTCRIRLALSLCLTPRVACR